MTRIILIINILLATSLFGNDYYYHQLSGGSLMPADDNETSVELVSEVIIFELFDDHYTVTVNFNFFNHGETVKLLVGFPYVADTGGYVSFSTRGSLYDFQTWVNGTPVETRNTPIDIDLSDQKLLGVNYAYTKEVVFTSNQQTKTDVSYNARYGDDGAYKLASYLYGSGKGWYNCIGKAEVIIKNSSTYWIYGIRAGSPFNKSLSPDNTNLNHQWNNNDVVFVMENFEPEYNDCIDIYVWVPMFDMAPKPLPYYFFYQTLIFKPNDLWYLTKEQLRILRNLFYALHGYNFRDSTLLSYFSSHFGFYEVNPEFSEDLLTPIERQNIAIIQREEQSR
jgi:hypothetical protein